MSICRCDRCERLVDTDDEVGDMIMVGNSERWWCDRCMEDVGPDHDKDYQDWLDTQDNLGYEMEHRQ